MPSLSDGEKLAINISKNIRKNMEDIQTLLANGAAQTFDMYKSQVGRFAAFSEVLILIEEEVKKMYRADIDEDALEE